MSARRAVIPVFVPHLGCPNDCVFCNQRRISGAKKPAVPETVRQALKNAEGISAPGGRELAFYGGSFTAIPVAEQEALLETAFEAEQSGFLKGIRLSTRPDCIDGEVLERLKRFGVTTIELGAQSMDEGVLRASGRGHSAEDTKRAAGLIKAAGFELILQMMTGLPGDTEEKSIETARSLCALKPDGVRIYPTVIIEDTPLCDLWRAGRYREHSVEDAVELCAKLLDIFEEAGVPVIRLGLNPTDELSGGGAVAGAYHPALGEKCMSRRLRKKAEALLSGHEGESVTILVPRGKLSAAIGQKRENVEYLKERFGLKGLKIKEGDVPALCLKQEN